MHHFTLPRLSCNIRISYIKYKRLTLTTHNSLTGKLRVNIKGLQRSRFTDYLLESYTLQKGLITQECKSLVIKRRLGRVSNHPSQAGLTGSRNEKKLQISACNDPKRAKETRKRAAVYSGVCSDQPKLDSHRSDTYRTQPLPKDWETSGA